MSKRSTKVWALLTLPLLALLLGAVSGTVASESLQGLANSGRVEATISSVRDLMRPRRKAPQLVTVCGLPVEFTQCVVTAPPPVTRTPDAASGVRFSAVDIYLTPEPRQDGSVPTLGAWQVEYTGTSGRGDVLLVGVEGGEGDAYAEPAFYDPEALAGGRVILASYAIGPDLPSARTRVARLHLQTPQGEFDSAVSLIAAGDERGDRIDATVEVVPVETAQPNNPIPNSTPEDTAHTEG